VINKQLFKCFEKIAVTSDQLAAANDRMYKSIGAVHVDDIADPRYKRHLASNLQGGYAAISNIGIPKEVLTPAAQARLAQHGHTHGIAIGEEADTKTLGSLGEGFGVGADPNFSSYFPDTVKMVHNWAKNHELRELQQYPIKLQNLDPRLSKYIDDPTPGNLKTGPKSYYEDTQNPALINAGWPSINPYGHAVDQELRFASHNSPSLTLRDIGIAATAGKDSDQAKKFLGGSHDPADKATAREFRGKFQADDMNLGPHVLQARLAAKKAGDPNWRSVTSSDPAVSAARTAIRGSYDTPSMANFRAMIQNFRDREMNVLREALPNLSSQLERHHKPGASEYEKPNKELINETADSWASLPLARRIGMNNLNQIAAYSSRPMSDILRDEFVVDRAMALGATIADRKQKSLRDFLTRNKEVQHHLRILKLKRRSDRDRLVQDVLPGKPIDVRQKALDELMKLQKNKPSSKLVHEIHTLPTTEPKYRPRSRKFRRRR